VVAGGLQRDELGLARRELEAEHGVAVERDGSPAQVCARVSAAS
jgi:hypothetical protein